MIKRTFLRVAALSVAVVVLVGCAASGAKFQDMSDSIPTMKAGEGRIYFLRSTAMMGMAVQPELRLNGKVVGESKPGGFFYVDRAAGNYVASVSTETEKTASFVLAAGETKYLRTSVSMGIVMGRIVVELESPEDAKAALANLSYTGAATSKK